MLIFCVCKGTDKLHEFTSQMTQMSFFFCDFLFYSKFVKLICVHSVYLQYLQWLRKISVLEACFMSSFLNFVPSNSVVKLLEKCF